MRFSKQTLLSSLALLASSQHAAAENIIESNSLNTCMDNSLFTADLFDFSLTPGNKSASVEINGFSSVTGNVVAVVQVVAYGFSVVNQTVDPCSLDLPGFCPMTKGPLSLPPSTITLGDDVLAQIPSIAYSVPDIDGVVRLKVYSVSESGGFGDQVICLEADLSNTKSVYQKAVGWVTAIIAGAGLIAAGITSGLGNTNTAAHVAANAISLFGVFQAQAIIGLTSVTMPPIVQAWTQNFQWSMGIIRVGFLQNLATWYQRATGGTPTTYLSTLSTVSVQVEKKKRAIKRGLDTLASAIEWGGLRTLSKRQTTSTTATSSTELKNVIVRGIERVGFRAHIEQTNIFMTGLIFFIGILIIASICVALAKAAIEGAAKAGWMKSDKFRDFRNGWRIVIKGILFRLVLLGFVQMSILCLWQIVERDSAAEVILALIVFLSMAGCLAWASYKVMTLAKRSVQMHKNPAYILYSDPTCLNKWGFLYVSYKATSYYFVIVLLGYILAKAIFIAFAQSSPIAQAVGLIIVEAAFLIAVSVLRPWMDKKTNVFNISIAVINFLNAIFLLIFSNAFGQPAMVSGIMGVIFAVYNIIFIFVLLIMVLVSSIYAIASKNPETRYQPMRDDRGSFIKSQSALTTELDALGATARGDDKSSYPQQAKEIDDETSSSDSLSRPATQPNRFSNQNLQPTNTYTPSQAPASPGHPPQMQQAAPMAAGYGQHRPNTAPGQQGPPQSFSRPGQGPYGPPRSAHSNYPPQNFNSRPQDRTASPWQRGAGYD
ncbi:putative flavin carrier protein 3 [Knufia fluminis]|uniref:Flavin carrier protein 3 n=1 Tax=Knufia fluminis TaxID=191047 RepID=A0AAN8F676_9EURO|nr:putative flavin carrier protein 3 [Knufia fluminis]